MRSWHVLVNFLYVFVDYVQFSLLQLLWWCECAFRTT